MPSRSSPGQRGDSASAVTPAKAFMDLRKVVLRRTAAAFGLHPTAALPNVWGALVEVGFDTGSATLMAAADGSAGDYPLTPVFRASEIVLAAMDRLQAATDAASGAAR